MHDICEDLHGKTKQSAYINKSHFLRYNLIAYNIQNCRNCINIYTNRFKKSIRIADTLTAHRKRKNPTVFRPVILQLDPNNIKKYQI